MREVNDRTRASGVPTGSATLGSRARRWPVTLLSMMLLFGATSACGVDDEPSTSGTATTGTSATQPPATTPTTIPSIGQTSGTNTLPPATPSSSTLAIEADPVAVDPSWERYQEDWFVWGVADDDVLNARTAPGVAHPIVTKLAPGMRGIRTFSVGSPIGDEVWRPIEVPGGAAWVNARYLRPQGPATIEIRGTPDPAVASAANAVAEALRTVDLAALADLVDPDRGVLLSPYAYANENGITLTPAMITAARTDRRELLWGYTDGEGAPIRQTVLERLRTLSGLTALTSTSVIGYDQPRLHYSNIVDNLTQVFPDSAVVEYHFAGTSLNPDFDWTSLRMAFDVSGPTPTLVALVQDTWTV